MSPEEANRTELTKSQKQPTRLSRKMNLKEPKRAKHSKKKQKRSEKGKPMSQEEQTNNQQED